MGVLRHVRAFAWSPLRVATMTVLVGCGSLASPAVTHGGDQGGDAGTHLDEAGVEVPNDAGKGGDDATVGNAPDGGSGSSDAGTTPKGDAATGKGPNGNESWVWVYTDFATSLTTIGANKTSFTHVSPAFYSVNYAYKSGVAYYSTCPNGGSDSNCTGNATNDFDGLTTKQFTAKATGFGLATIPLIYGGADNQGMDTGIQNLLDDTGGAQEAFITAMTAEAVANGYGGYNLDWETGDTINGSYAAKFVAFVNAFKVALSPHGMTLSADAIVSNINGTFCSSNDGFLDFGLLGKSSIDRILIEDYINAAVKATTTCQSAVLSTSAPIDCDYTMTGELNMMCPQNLPVDKAVIGLEADPGSTNPIAGTAFAAIKSYGFTRVAVWPQAPFMNTSGIKPAGSTWYTFLRDFLTN